MRQLMARLVQTTRLRIPQLQQRLAERRILHFEDLLGLWHPKGFGSVSAPLIRVALPWPSSFFCFFSLSSIFGSSHSLSSFCPAPSSDAATSNSLARSTYGATGKPRGFRALLVTRPACDPASHPPIPYTPQGKRPYASVEARRRVFRL